MTKKLMGVLSVAVLVTIAIGGAYLFPKVVLPPFGAISGPTVYDAMEFRGGVTNGSTNSTSTPASMTMRLSDVQNFSTVIVSPTGAAAAKTLTFFASSSAPAWLPLAGDRQTTCFVNSTTTAATTLVFAAGTGIDLQVATSTGGTGGAMDLTIAAGGTGCFDFIRGAVTATTFDIQANLTEFGDAD